MRRQHTRSSRFVVLATLVVAIAGVTAMTAMTAAGASVQDGTESTTETVELDVETTWADYLGNTEMILGGNLTALEGADTAFVGFEYRENGSDGWSFVTAGSVNETGQFTGTTGALEPGTTYEYRAVANDPDQSTFVTGATETFTTLHEPPNLTTEPVAEDAVDESSASLEATVHDLGSAEEVTVRFRYWEAGTSGWERTQAVTVTEPGAVEQRVTDLDPETTYEYEAVGIAGFEFGYGGERSFTTDAESSLAVSTGRATDVTDGGAWLSGEVTSLGADVPAVGFELRPANASDWSRVDAEMDDAGSFGVWMSDLESNTTYEFRAVATDGESTVRGDPVTFTTYATPPSVETEPEPANVTSSSATLEATLTEFGDDEEATVRVRYFETNSWARETTEEVTVDRTGTVAVDATGLDPGTTYEYYAIASSENSHPAYGDTHEFTTEPDLSVSTGEATDVTDGTATLHGDLESAEGASDLETGIEYREQSANAWERSTATLRSDGSFSVDVTDLDAGTLYEYRAVAESGAVRDEGAIRKFQTQAYEPEPPAVETGGAHAVDESSATVTAAVLEMGDAENVTVAIEYRSTGADTWETAEGETVTDPGTVAVTLADLDPETTYEYRAVATANEQSVTGQTATVTTKAATQVPAVDSLSGTEDSPPNPHAELAVGWSVSDADGDLESVTVTVTDSSGTVVYDDATDVSGATGSGSEQFRVKHGAGDTYEVTLEVTDAEGSTTTERTAVDA